MSFNTQTLQQLNMFELRLVDASITALLMPKWIGMPIYYALFGFARVYGAFKVML